MSTRSASRALVALLFTTMAAAALASGCGVDNELVGGTCAAGYVQCGLLCVRLSSDPANCGGCGQACRPGGACTDGMCDWVVDASADSPISLDDAADGPVLDGGSPYVDSGVPGATAEASANDDAPSSSTVEASAAVDPVEATDDDAAPDTGTPTDPTSDSAGATSTDAAPAEPDAGAEDSIDGGDDSSGDDAPVVDSAVVESAVADSPAESSASDASTSGDSSASDGFSGEAASPCAPPLVSCGESCLDVTADPLNCGGCGVVCASQLCDDSTCVGATSGGIVYIGHDYTTTLSGTAQARVLSNAVFVPESNPLHVMSYERYAAPGAISHVDAILNGVAHQVGRTLSIDSTASDDYVRDQLALPSYDVLLVHDQPGAPDGALAALGAKWASTLSTFTLGGGVVVVLDGGTGIGQMPTLATGSALLSVSAHAPTAVGTPLQVTSLVDVLSTGVVSPYGAGQSSVSLTTEPNGGNVVYVVELGADAGSSAPIVVHKAF